MESSGQRRIIVGVSPALAMTKMDDEVYPEADIYTEDERSATLISEIVAVSSQKDLVARYQTIPYGAANVGRSLGQMVSEKRFPRPSIVFLDGDQAPSPGCIVLPGEDAPERVVFESLAKQSFGDIGARLNRSPSDVAEACVGALHLGDHHDWVRFAADRLSVRGDVLWQNLCSEWARKCLTRVAADEIGEAILAAIVQFGGTRLFEQSLMPTQPKLELRE